MSKRTQCTHVPRGASGSSQRSAKLCAPEGAPLQRNGGDESSPSAVCCFGIVAPSVKALEVKLNGPEGCASRAGESRAEESAVVLAISLSSAERGVARRSPC